MDNPLSRGGIAGDSPRTCGAERHRRGDDLSAGHARRPADRDFVFPDPEGLRPPTLVLFTQSKPGLADNPAAKVGIKVISIPDIRWGRRDIKTVQLLYPSMGKMMAKKAGADDAWMVEDGSVTEGTSNNAYIVKGNTIITRHLSQRHPARDHPRGGAAVCARGADGGRRAGLYHRRGARRRTRRSSPRPRPS